MLADPLKVGTVIGATAIDAVTPASVLDFHVLPVRGDGVVLRRAATPDAVFNGIGTIVGQVPEMTLRISHSETQENKPYTTSRVVERFDVKYIDPDGKAVSESAYAVFVSPEASFISANARKALRRTLALFLLQGEVNAELGTVDGNDQTQLRILAGEG